MSKELTPLEALNDLIDYLEAEHYTLSENEDVVERKQIIEKALKALEIIKEKKVNVRAFLKCCYSEDGLTIYNNQCDDKQEKESKELTKEEFDLLKEVLL